MYRQTSNRGAKYQRSRTENRHRVARVTVRWVHSEAQIANALTKGGAKELDMYYQMKGTWRIVQDEQMRSSRKRRSEGITTFQQSTSEESSKKTQEESTSKGGAGTKRWACK